MQQKKSGFTFGVFLGAALGVGAMILSDEKEGAALKKKIVSKVHDLKEQYPEQVEKIEGIIDTALSEAKTVTRELRELRVISEDPKKDKPSAKKEPQRTFKRG